jgi:hypothetical protein
MHSAALHGLQVLRWKTAWLAIYTAACTALFLNPLLELFRLSISADTYSHILVIPLISICMIYMEREAVLQRTDSSLRAQRKIRPFHFHGRIIGAGNPWLLVLGMVWLLLGFREPRFSCGSFSASLSTPDGTAA